MKSSTLIEYDCEQFLEILCLVYDWQTILAGIFAVVAAGFTVVQLRRQLAAEERRHREMRESKAWAARARLPDALSAVVEYSEQASRFIVGLRKDMPESPDAYIQEIKESIEFLPPDAAGSLFSVAVFFQIFNSRIREPTDSPLWEIERLYDSAKLRCISERIFPFARKEGEIPTTEITQDDMKSALRMNVGFANYHKASIYDSVILNIERRIKH
ncbi:MAG: hypothetical protein AB7N54_16640 [Alphaproteobacteria bacterium]